MTRDSELIARLREAYITLLRMPHGGFRDSPPGQRLLSYSRDALAYAEGRSPQDVQDECEATSRLEAIAEPVAWRWKTIGSELWNYGENEADAHWCSGPRKLVQPLYTSPVQTREDGIREALKPFARVARQLDRDYPDYADNISVFFELTHGDFRRIAALLS